MSIYSNEQSRFKRYLKRKVFFSNELKKALLIAFLEAKTHKIYVTKELILYGILSQPNSISARLISTIFSEFLNNKSLTPYIISKQLKEINTRNFEEKFGINKPKIYTINDGISKRLKGITNLKGINNQNFALFNIIKPHKFYSEFWDENATIPWLSPEVKDILRATTSSLLKSKKQINVLTTKEILFELLNREATRKLLENLFVNY